jgi:hypothetical protein
MVKLFASSLINVYKPCWITGDDPSVKNHLFIFKMVNGFFKPVWQSSNLDRPNYEADVVWLVRNCS